eukprot:Skav229329  [mRNA]  locus=scaffold2917:25238:25495:+ [translate_table: standard]
MEKESDCSSMSFSGDRSGTSWASFSGHLGCSRRQTPRNIKNACATKGIQLFPGTQSSEERATKPTPTEKMTAKAAEMLLVSIDWR